MTIDDSTWAPASASWDSATWARVTCDDLTLWPVGDRPRPRGVRRLVDKVCFENAFRRAQQQAWHYCEGLASWRIAFPIHHAWCVDEHGHVVETTWPELGVEYRGKVFPLADVARWRLKASETRAGDPSMLSQVAGPCRGDTPTMLLVYTERFWEELEQRSRRTGAP